MKPQEYILRMKENGAQKDVLDALNGLRRCYEENQNPVDRGTTERVKPGNNDKNYSIDTVDFILIAALIGGFWTENWIPAIFLFALYTWAEIIKAEQQ